MQPVSEDWSADAANDRLAELLGALPLWPLCYDDEADLFAAAEIEEHTMHPSFDPDRQVVSVEYKVSEEMAPKPEDLEMDVLRLRYRTWSAGGRPDWP